MKATQVLLRVVAAVQLLPRAACPSAICRLTLLIATDGLWKYAKPARIAKAAAIRPLDVACAALVDGARLRNGELQDDVAIVLAELA
jgi:hypothetical protein